MRVFNGICLFLLSFGVFAESIMPAGCRSLPVQGESVTMKNEKPKLFFIHNLTENDLWLTHPANKAGVNAGWSSRIQADKWSALVVAKGPFDIECIESRPGHEQQIPCQGAIAVCEWKKTKMPKDQKGDFWAAEDMSLEGLKTAVGDRGFVLPA